MSSITWSVTVCDELNEITRLMNFLTPQVGEDDEILIQYDEKNVTEQVMNFLKIHSQIHDNVKVVGYPLNRDFGKFKSNLTRYASKEFIFQLDADEIPNKFLVQRISDILNSNPDIDLFFIPRINTVEGITQQHISKWSWNVRKMESQVGTKEIDPNSDEYKFLDKNKFIKNVEANDDKDTIKITYLKPIINFPDYQTRIYKNTDEVQWLGKVHEKITGYSTFTSLPAEEQFCIYHPKEIKRQEKQNEFYSKI